MFERAKFIYSQLGNRFMYFIHKNFYFLTACLITAISLAARFCVCLHPTNDVTGYIFKWMNEITQVGFSNFYQVESDYSPLFLFIIAIYTLLPAGEFLTIGGYSFYKNWMIYLKGTYFAIEVVIAIGIYLIVKQLTNNQKSAWLGYIVFLCLPVQFFNSAVWGNADSLYFICFVYAIYFLLKGRDGLTFFITGVCLGVKLQAVFILPLLVYLMASGKIQLRKSLLLPVGIIATFIPAYCFGATLLQPFTFWLKQLGGYSLLTLGCANIWHLINIKSDLLGTFNIGSTILGLLLIGLFTAIVFARKIKLTNENLLTVSVFLIAIVPMFLPHMHERYFYALDVFVVVYCIVNKKHYWLILLMQLSSGIAYHNYLSGRHFIVSLGEDSVHIASWINLFVLTFLFYQVLKLPTDGSMEDFANMYQSKIQPLNKPLEKNTNKTEQKNEKGE